MSIYSFSPGARLNIDHQIFHLRRKLSDNRWQLENELDGELKVHSESELESLYADGDLSFVADSDVESFGIKEVVAEKVKKTFADYPFELQVIAAKRLKYVKAYKADGQKEQLRYLEQVAKESGDKKLPSFSTLRRWSNDFDRSQQNICSLIPKYSGRGNRKERFPAPVIEIAYQKLFELYLKLEPESLKNTLSAIRNAIHQKNVGRPAKNHFPVPGKKLLKRLLGTIDAYEIMKAREGKAAADHYFRESYKSGERVQEPLERVEIDHTVLDLIVVHHETHLPLGRPTLTIMKDRCTRCVMGYYISFDPPNYIQVMKCLAHAIKPKSYVSTKYPEIKNPWPCHGIPQMLVVDNGREFHSKDLEAAALSLLMDIRYTPVANPWWKGSVERFFRTISKDLIHQIPGTTFSNIFDKGDYDAENLAIMTLDVLDRVFHNWICDVYHQTRHRAMLSSPISKWRELCIFQ